MIYLASPYSHPDPAVREDRFLATEKFLAEKLLQNICLYSPIVHCHALSIKYNLPFSASFWQRYNYKIFRLASGLLILKLPDWAKSVGVSQEIMWAHDFGIGIEYAEWP